MIDLKWLSRAARAAIAVSLAWTAPLSAAEPVRFVVVGDLPYTAGQARILETEIRPAIRRGGFPFVIHLGDFKSGGIDCTDEGLATARAQIMSLIPERVFYTPGDNDWTDCDRSKLRRPVSELMRLARLRAVFYGAAQDIPPSWALARQKNYPENAMWRHGAVQFATLHVVGTNNGRFEIKRDPPRKALDGVDARDSANRTWIERIFASALGSGARAVVIAMQADPTKVKYKAECDAETRVRCDGFKPVRRQLRAAAASFGGPVLLIHGDTGPFCLDRDFGGDAAPRLWRLNSAGDYNSEGSVVRFDPGDPATPFAVRRLLEGTELDSEC